MSHLLYSRNPNVSQEEVEKKMYGGGIRKIKAMGITLEEVTNDNRKIAGIVRYVTSRIEGGSYVITATGETIREFRKYGNEFEPTKRDIAREQEYKPQTKPTQKRSFRDFLNSRGQESEN